jgi:ABC-2 type transport system ATP-binding protein
MADDVVLSVNGLVKRYGDFTAVNGVRFDVHKGEVFGLLGPNGAGKSTLIGMLTCVVEPTEGQASVHGYDVVRDRDKVKRLVGLVPQELALYGTLTTEENLSFFGQMYGLSGSRLKERIETGIELAQLQEWRNKPVQTFSGGMKRRLNLAVGLLHNPEILFLDEPTVGVDPQSRNHIFSSVQKLVELGLTVIYTTHYMEEAELLCNRVSIYDRGQIIDINTPQMFISQVENKNLDLGLDEPVAGVIDAIRALPGVEEATISDDKVRIKAADLQEILAPLFTCLQTMGVKVRSLQTPQSNLETVFLNLTGRKLRD